LPMLLAAALLFFFPPEPRTARATSR